MGLAPDSRVVSTGQITIDPSFFDAVLPDLVEKGVLTARESTGVFDALRKEGADAAAVRLTELLERGE